MEIPTELGKPLQVVGELWRNETRTSQGSSYQFWPRDLEGVVTPHDDRLVIHVIIANYDVARVFIDSGSSIDILFKDAFDQMQVDLYELHPMSTSLFNFSGHEGKPLGQINLPLSLGEE